MVRHDPDGFPMSAPKADAPEVAPCPSRTTVVKAGLATVGGAAASAYVSPSLRFLGVPSTLHSAPSVTLSATATSTVTVNGGKVIFIVTQGAMNIGSSPKVPSDALSGQPQAWPRTGTASSA